MISYSPFYKTLNNKNITQYKLMKDFLISSSVINRIRNNESITLKTIEDLCNVLKCNIGDIVTFT